MNEAQWKGFLEQQRTATKAAAAQLPIAVRIVFAGGPLDGQTRVVTIPPSGRGHDINFEFEGWAYRSVVPWNGKAVQVCMQHVASPIGV